MRRGLVLVSLLITAALAAGTGIAVAAFTTHRSNPQTFAAGSFTEPVAADLVAQSRTNDGGASSTQVQYGLKLRNVGDDPVDLSTVTMRYWFTADDTTGVPIAACYFATFGCGQLDQSVVDLPDLLQDADHYVEVSFAGGGLDPGEAAVLEQLAFRDPAGVVYRQDNDHSFLAQSSFTDNPHVSVYVDGQLVWGDEPVPAAAIESVEVLYANLDPDPLSNAIRPGLRLRNTGTVDLDRRRLTMRYWFTAEGSSPLNGYCDFAEIGCASITLRFGTVAPARPGADRYLEVGFADGTLEASTGTGQIQLRIHKADYSAFDERDDHSRGTNTEFEVTTTVTAYLDGRLIWGVEP